MATIRFGASCDGDGCSVAYNDYSVEDIITCSWCNRDLCPACATKTGHVQTVWADVDQAPELSCVCVDCENDLVNRVCVVCLTEEAEHAAHMARLPE